MPVEKLLPDFVPTVLHTLDFSQLKSIHGYAAHKRDMDAKAAMSASAVKTDEGAEFRRRLDDIPFHSQCSEYQEIEKGFTTMLM
jgi:hypothetical protein